MDALLPRGLFRAVVLVALCLESTRGSSSSGILHLPHAYFKASPGQRLDRWLQDARVRFIAEEQGVNVTNTGSLRVLSDGYYHCYASVGFVIALRDASMASQFMLELVRVRGDSTHALLRSWADRHWDSRCAMKTLYVAGVFWFRAGDEIVINVMNRDFVWQSPRRTFIGIRGVN
jgi:hypothetical protein